MPQPESNRGGMIEIGASNAGSECVTRSCNPYIGQRFDVIVSSSLSPLENLALEQQFLTEREDNILLLYRNTPSVIVGKHQSIEAEVDVEYCREKEIEIVQRSSGGGTVYHDLGNINWSFISNRTEIPLLDSNPTRPMIDALAYFGVTATAGCRNELRIDGWKISGTAAQIGRTRQLFHGTLLHRSNLNVLEQVLKGDITKRGKKVASVPSKVINLCEYPFFDCQTEELIDRLRSFFVDYYSK